MLKKEPGVIRVHFSGGPLDGKTESRPGRADLDSVTYADFDGAWNYEITRRKYDVKMDVENVYMTGKKS